MKRGGAFLVVLTLVATAACLDVWAQSEEATEDAYPQNAEVEDSCVQYFDMEKIAGSEQFKQFVAAKDADISDFVYCRGTLDADFINRVRGLNLIRSNRFGERFDWYQFWIALAKAREIAPGMIEDCIRVNGVSRSTCQALLDGFMRKDASVCDRSVKPGSKDHAMCRAEILRDPTLVIGLNRRDVDNMYLLRAVSERNVAICENIRLPLIKRMCRAASLDDISECEDTAALKPFKIRYCAGAK